MDTSDYLEDNNSEISDDKNNEKTRIKYDNPVINELVSAIKNNNFDKVKEIINKNPKLVNAKLKSIHYPCEYDRLLNIAANNLQITKFLLENGANPDLEDSACQLPIEVTIDLDIQDKLSIIQLFIKYGSELNIIKLVDKFTDENDEIVSTRPRIDRKTAEIFAKMGVDMSDEDLLIPTLELMEDEIEKSYNDNQKAFDNTKECIKFIDLLINIGVNLHPYNWFTKDGEHKILKLIHETLFKTNNFVKTLENILKNNSQLPAQQEKNIEINKKKNFYLYVINNLKFLLNKSYINGADFDSIDKSLNTELLKLSENLNKLTNTANSEKLEKNLTTEKTIYQILKLDIKNIFQKTIERQDDVPEEITTIVDKIKDIIKTNKNVSPYDKLITLSYLSGVKFVNQKGELLYLITKTKDYDDLVNYVKYIPFNYDFFFDDNCKYLRARVLELRNENTRDITGKTINIAMSNYQEFTPILFERDWQKLFKTKDNCSIEPKENLKSILFNPKSEFLATNRKIIPITENNITNDPDKSYRYNEFHKKFVNSCSLFSLLTGESKQQEIDLLNKTKEPTKMPLDVVAKIVGYTDGTLKKQKG
jgi:hypothetical protein